jgi:sec-independent protein translocase protein TatA
MFGETIGIGELLLILLIVMVIFGAGKLPQIGEGLGKAIANFKKSVSGKDAKK